ncbi:MAG: helix-turn-helix domain-containing protein [Phormidesmis sp. CAN_BIN36]|nr:helix-turn-helix domain-containing protein [Phormidesmis sp. CAN_BIN36]
MGTAGKALKQVLVTYRISQIQLASTMGIASGNISRWVNESRDPSAESAIDIRDALETIDPDAAKAFTLLYWERRINDEKE